MLHEQRFYEEVVDVLASGYSFGDIKEALYQIICAVGPEIACLALEEAQNEKSLLELWQSVKKKEEIQDSLKKLIGQVDRLAVIYFASKFENNQWVGTNTIKNALEAERARKEGGD